MSAHLHQSPQKLREKQLTEDYALLSAQHIAVSQKRRSSLNPADQVVLQQQEQDLFQQLQQVDTELEALKRESMDNNQRVGILKQNLPLLDFNSAKKKFEQLICEFDVDEQGGSAVFLIQKSQAMLGEICLQGIQDTIRVKPGETLKPYRLEFFPGVTWDEKEILRALGKQLGKFEEVTDIDRYAQEIRKILIGALRGYTTLFIELHGWDILTEQQQKRLLHWFLEDFWKHLVAERDRIAEDYDNVRCIAAIVVAGELEPDLQQLPYFQCTSENWQGEIKIIELPLENWTTKDIEEWLKKCPKLSKKDSKAMAERIYRITKGLPIAARDRLEKELQIYCPIAS